MLIDKVRETLIKYNMLQKGDKVIVGVSGGPDSVTLLHILVQLQGEMNLSLHVAHLNHKLRGKDADEDAKFVKTLAQKCNLPFTIKAVNVAGFAKKKKLTLEEAARKRRYAFLEDVANFNQATKIALGHNADDKVETILMWLLRGAGRSGLMGIPPIRKSSLTDLNDRSGNFLNHHTEERSKEDFQKFFSSLDVRKIFREKNSTKNHLTIIRPLIEVFRVEIEKYLKRYKLSYRLDNSNLSPAFMRNKIRLQLLPLIRKKYSPNFDCLLLQTAQILSDEKQILDEEINRLLKKVIVNISINPVKIYLDLNKFMKYNISLKRQIIRRIIFFISSGKNNLNYRKAEELIKFANIGKINKRILFADNIVITKRHNILEVAKEKKTSSSPKIFNYKLRINGTTNIPILGSVIETSIFKKPQKFKYNKSKLIAHLDANKVKLPIFIRNRKKGDNIVPLGMRGHKKIKDFFIDHKIPQEQRNSIPLVVSKDQVLWITGYPCWAEQINDSMKITKETKRILEIRLTPKKFGIRDP